MYKFDGFPPGAPRMAQIRAAFFTDLLPLIDDLAELKVTLFCFYALQQREGDIRYLLRRDFINSAELLRGLEIASPGQEIGQVLDHALERALKRGTLLMTEITLDSGQEKLYFMNTAMSRAAVEQIQAGHWKPGKDTPLEILPERPNIYRLYEDNIGVLTPMIAERLKDAEREYLAEWVGEAFRLAVEHNKRNWHYVEAILKRWQAEGKDDGTLKKEPRKDEQKRIAGDFSEFIKRY
jgi:DNA replication protein